MRYGATHRGFESLPLRHRPRLDPAAVADLTLLWRRARAYIRPVTIRQGKSNVQDPARGADDGPRLGPPYRRRFHASERCDRELRREADLGPAGRRATELHQCVAREYPPNGAVCTWVAREAVGNGNKFKAPKNGTIHKLRLIACNGGKFTLQLVKLNSAGKAKVDHTGPVIKYKADPRQVDGNENTECGGDNSDDYITQTFNVNVAVSKGDYIAVKTAKLGVLHCSGQSMDLYSPPLAAGNGFRTAAGDTGCGLLVRLSY